MLLVAPILLIAAVLYVAYPLLAEAAPASTEPQTEEGRREALLAEKANLIAGLKDIEMDYRTEKLSDEDYQRLKTEFEGRAIGILKKIDQLESSTPRKKGKSKSKPHRLKKA